MPHVPTGVLIPLAILIISLLVIIHEGGHYLVARAFGMRVLTFSIGFGPVLARWRPRGSETVFQIAAIPVLAYVQIAGMNPREVVDPNDRGSYQNASPTARFLTIAGGPLANFVAAGLALFLVLAIGGRPVMPPNAQIGRVLANTPAAVAGIQADDVVREINGTPTPTWSQLLRVTGESNGRALHLVIDRHGQRVTTTVTPRMNAETHRYMMGVEVKSLYRPVPITQAFEAALVAPADATAQILHQIRGMFARRVPVQLVGPVGIVNETVQQARQGWRPAVEWAGLISLQLFIFNLLPIPALDGGRLVLLGIEMATRKRVNPQIEQRVLAYSLMLMIGLFLVVTSRELWGLIVPRLVGLFRG